jgi:hypothetical protein
MAAKKAKAKKDVKVFAPDAKERWFQKLKHGGFGDAGGARKGIHHAMPITSVDATRARQLVDEYYVDQLHFTYPSAEAAFSILDAPIKKMAGGPVVKEARVKEPVGILPAAQLSLFDDGFDIHISRHKDLMRSLAYGTQAMVNLKQMDPSAVDKSQVEQALNYLSMGLMVHDRLLDQAIGRLPAPAGAPVTPALPPTSPVPVQGMEEEMEEEEQESDEDESEAAKEAARVTRPEPRSWAIPRN